METVLNVLNVPDGGTLIQIFSMSLRLGLYVLLLSVPLGLLFIFSTRNLRQTVQKLRNSAPYVLFAALSWHYMLHHAQAENLLITEVVKLEQAVSK